MILKEKGQSDWDEPTDCPFTFVAMSNLVLSNLLSFSNHSEEKQKNSSFFTLRSSFFTLHSSLFTLHSSLNLSQVLHQNLDLSTIAKLDDTLLSDLAYTLAGEIELASDFFQTLLMTTNTIAVAENFAFTLF